MKTLVFDSSALISISESCMASSLAFLKQKAQLRFVSPNSVVEECIERPSTTRQHGFSAFRIKKLFSDGVLEKKQADQNTTKKILYVANQLFSAENKKLELIQVGEAECLALLILGVGDGLIMDEKTLRLLVESPERLREILKGEYDGKIEMNEKMMQQWQQMTRGIKMIRSAELIAVAAERGYFDGFKSDKNSAFHSAMPALRSYGCSLTNEELKEFEQIYV